MESIACVPQFTAKRNPRFEIFFKKQYLIHEKLNKKSRSPHGHTQRHASKLAEEEEKLKSYALVVMLPW